MEASNRIFVASLVIVLLVFLAAHASLYFRGPGNGTKRVQMLQAGLGDLAPEVLSERQPLVIMDELVVPDHKALQASTFSWQGIVSSSSTSAL